MLMLIYTCKSQTCIQIGSDVPHVTFIPACILLFAIGQYLPSV